MTAESGRVTGCAYAKTGIPPVHATTDPIPAMDAPAPTVWTMSRYVANALSELMGTTVVVESAYGGDDVCVDTNVHDTPSLDPATVKVAGICTDDPVTGPNPRWLSCDAWARERSIYSPPTASPFTIVLVEPRYDPSAASYVAAVVVHPVTGSVSRTYPAAVTADDPDALAKDTPVPVTLVRESFVASIVDDAAAVSRLWTMAFPRN
jgi:hypothetical protein